MRYPIEPTGQGLFVQWCRNLLWAAKSKQILQGRGYRIRETPDGTFLELIPGGGSGAIVSMYKFVSMDSEHIVCHTWDGETEGTDPVRIAKPWNLRHSIVSQTIDGVAVTFSAYSTSAQTRLATSGGESETQVMVPRYLTTSRIWAVTAPTDVDLGTEEEPDVLTLLDLNIDGRAYSAV